MIKITELDIEVEDVHEFNDEASEILEALCIELSKQPGMDRPADPECDSFLEETNFSHFWLKPAITLIEDEISRLFNIGVKYFGEKADFDIQTSWYQEQ